MTSLLYAFFLAVAIAAPLPQGIAAEKVTFKDVVYDVVRLNPAQATLELHWKQADGSPYHNFHALRDDLQKNGRELTFATNAGIYARDYTPLGLYIEDKKILEPLNRKTGGGNFFLKPNGVFCIDAAGAHVLETESYFKADLKPRIATQSGPMLLIDGAYHPKFIPDSDSLNLRNGVGVNAAKEAVFVLSESPVNFYTFATLFKEKLGCKDALYLDGALSDLYCPALDRTSPGVDYVGILCVACTAEVGGRASSRAGASTNTPACEDARPPDARPPATPKATD